MRARADRQVERWRRTGHTDALADVFDEIAPRLLRLAIHLVGDIAASEDLVQTTFVVAIESAADWDASRPVEPWLTGILDHRAKDLLKSRRHRIERDAADVTHEDTPLERVMADENTREIVSAIDRLDEPLRGAMVLSVLHDMKPAAIAHALGRSPGAVRVQLHRGREILRKLLPAGLVAGTGFVAEPVRGLAQIKADVVAHAAAVNTGVAATGTVGGLLMSTKVSISGAAILIALLALFLAREGARESTPAVATVSSSLEKDETRATRSEASAPADSNSMARRVETVSGSLPSDVKRVRVHGRVVDSDSNAGIGGADVRFYPPQRARMSEIRRRWHDRFEALPDGTVSTRGWPAFAVIPAGQSRSDSEFSGNFTDETRLGMEDLTVYAPPAAGVEPIARAVADGNGEFEFPVDESLGFIVCSAGGYATRQRAVAPAEVNKASADEVSIKIAMRAAKPLAGYVVDENFKRIERRAHLAFFGYVNKPSRVQVDSTGKVVAGEPEKDPQVDTWIVETKPDGGFACELPAKMVYARCLEPDLDVVKRASCATEGRSSCTKCGPSLVS